MIHNMVFPTDWLATKAEGDPQGRTNREVQTEVLMTAVYRYVTLILDVQGVPQANGNHKTTDTDGNAVPNGRCTHS